MYKMDLPFELILHVFKFLSYSDRTIARLVCKQFYSASTDNKFICDEVFAIKVHTDRHLDNVISVLEGSERIFRNFHFVDVCFTSEFYTIFKKYGLAIREILISNCVLSEKQFVDMLLECKNLKSLTVSFCEDLLMGGVISNMKTLILQNLKVLNFHSTRYLSDAILTHFISICPNIETLGFANCYINFHDGVFGFLYPQLRGSILQRPTNNGLTFKCIMQILELKSKNIKSLDFSFTYMNAEALSKLCQIPGLQLQCLNVKNCKELKFGQLHFARWQTHLTELNISNSATLYDNVLHEICNCLVNLKILKIACCPQLTDNGLRMLNRLQNLTYLDISNPWLSSTPVVNTLCVDKYRSMESFIANNVQINEKSFAAIINSFSNLEELQLCGCLLTNESVKNIFMYSTKLRLLRLPNCLKISNLYPETNVDRTEKLALLQKINTFITDNINSNNLYSTILENNKEFTVLCDALICKPHHLRNLSYLDLNNCVKITDEVFQFSFHFKELRVLLLSHTKITMIGILCIVLNCPAIEVLDLSYCHINNVAMYFIVKHLKRLQELYIRNCTGLTDTALELISQYCTVLKELDVRGCKMKKYMIHRIIEMPTVCNVRGFMEESHDDCVVPQVPPLPIF